MRGVPGAAGATDEGRPHRAAPGGGHVHAAALRRTAREWRRAVRLQRVGADTPSASRCGGDFLVGVGGSGEGIRPSVGMGKG